VAGIKDISTIWTNIKEIDLKPIRDAATHPVRIVLVGAQGSGRHSLAEQMRTDPARPGVHAQTPVVFIPADEMTEAPVAHLIIVIVDATRADFRVEQLLVKKWSEAGKNVLVFINKLDLIESNIVLDPMMGWHANRVIHGSVPDVAFLLREFVPVVLELLPQQHLALARQFPLFRLTIARQLISDTCFSNAAYSFSTGLAEIVPVLDIPLNVTDMIVLTKSQAFLAYKLGLLVGFSTRWQDYVTEFGSVIGGGFLWRQIARQMIGLIPAWGIIPKVAVSYSGTYVVGNAILGWYLTGRHLSPKQMRALSVQAFSKGKEYAQRLGKRLPRPRLGKRKKNMLPAAQKKPELTQGEITISPNSSLPKAASSPDSTFVSPSGTADVVSVSPEEVGPANQPQVGKVPRPKRQNMFRRKNKEAAQTIDSRICSQCGKTSSADASFCQYCGNHFSDEILS
jgi:uncharacterized protein (DUF697 family)